MTRPENIQQYFKTINKSVTKLENVFQVKRKNPKKTVIYNDILQLPQVGFVRVSSHMM